MVCLLLKPDRSARACLSKVTVHWGVTFPIFTRGLSVLILSAALSMGDRTKGGHNG